MSDQSANEFYANPENRRPVGPPRRRRTGPRQLSNHIAIRFAPNTIALIRSLAGRAGMSVGSWIRFVVEREVERQLALPRTGSGTTPKTSLQGPPPQAQTANPSYLNKEPELNKV